MKFFEIPAIIINNNWANPITQNMKVKVELNNGEEFIGVFVGNIDNEITIEKEDGKSYVYNAKDIKNIH